MKNNLKFIYLNRIILFHYYDFKSSINIYIYIYKSILQSNNLGTHTQNKVELSLNKSTQHK